MRIADFIEKWEERVPLTLMEEWDNSGRQCGRFDRELKGIVFSLDLSREAVEEAGREGCNLIFTHHPALFHGIKTLDETGEVTNLLLSCLEGGLCVYSSHTAFDRVRGGVNHVLAERAGLDHLRPLQAEDPASPLLAYSDGMGLVGKRPSTSLGAYVKQLKEAFDVPALIYYGEEDRPIRKVAVLGGSGMDYWPQAKEVGAQLFLTADVKYHQAMDALAAGLALVDLGHYESEFPAMERAREWSGQILQEEGLSLPLMVAGAAESRQRKLL